MQDWLCPSVNWRRGANWHSLYSFLSAPPPPEGGPRKHTESDTLQVSISHSNLNHLPICPECFPAIFASNQLQKKMQGCFLETDWFSAHGAHLPELDVLWVMQIFFTNELHSTPP